MTSPSTRTVSYSFLLRYHEALKVSIGLNEASGPSRGGSPGMHTVLSALSAQRLCGKVSTQKLLHMLSWEGGMVSISPETLCSFAWLG